MSFKDTIKKAGYTVKKSVNDVTDTVKTEYKKGQLKNELSGLYETLGEVRYAELISGGDITEESVNLCKEIARVKAELDNLSLTKEMAEKLCKICGKNLPDYVTYCPYCGTKKDEKD